MNKSPEQYISPDQQGVFSVSFSGGVSDSVNVLVGERDKFLKERPLQPKREIREYFRINGERVPQNFSSLAAAMSSGRQFIMNSEHPQEYAGVSGLTESIVVNPQEIIEFQRTKSRQELSELPEFPDEELYGEDRTNFTFEVLLRMGYVEDKDIFDMLIEIDKEQFENYAEKMGLDVEHILSEQSYSFSEYIEGINHSIVGDADVQNRYYIISSFDRRNLGVLETYKDIIIVQDDEIISQEGIFMKSDRENGGHKNIKGGRRIFDHHTLIESYKRTKSLYKFDPQHCPIMEMQTGFLDDELYLLQYHRCRDIGLDPIPRFNLDRKLEPGEIEANFVRGVTPKEGIIVKTALQYPRCFEGGNYPLLEHQEASFDNSFDGVFLEMMSRTRIVNFSSVDNVFSDLVANHATMSQIFKPQVYINLGRENYRKLMHGEKGKGTKIGKMAIDISEGLEYPYEFDIRIISDGNRCFVKIMTSMQEMEEMLEQHGMSFEEYAKKTKPDFANQFTFHITD